MKPRIPTLRSRPLSLFEQPKVEDLSTSSDYNVMYSAPKEEKSYGG